VEGPGRPLLAGGSAAGDRSADPGGGRYPWRRAAPVSPRDGAVAVDLPAEAGADRRADRRHGVRRGSIRFEPDRTTETDGTAGRLRQDPTTETECTSIRLKPDPTADTGSLDVTSSR